MAFAVIGSILLFATRAATPFASIESEQGTKTANVTIGSDTAASSGQFVQFGAGTVTPPPPVVQCAGYSSWATSANWTSGQAPSAGQDATIAAGKKVVLDTDVPKLGGLTIPAGTELCFKDQAMTFRVGSVIVGGVLQMGTEAQPILSKVELVLDGLKEDPTYSFPATELNQVATAANFSVGNSVLAVKRGGRLELHGKKIDRTWTRLAVTAAKDSNTITLQESVAGQWAVGDKIVLAPSGLQPLENDESTITAISADGKTLTLAAPLNYQHASVATTLTAGAESRTIEERAEVGLLSHNLVVRGPDNSEATKYGGHIIGFYQAVQRLSGVEFLNLGQQGILGKYPLHFHHAIDATASRVEGNSIVRSFNRMIAIHNSNNLVFTNNVGHDTVGHAVMQENGTENGGTITKNLIMTVKRAPDGARLLAPGGQIVGKPDRIAPGNGNSDDTPAAFWLTHPNNIVTDNAATGIEGVGIWMDLAPCEFGDNVNCDARGQQFGTFNRNVAHSNQDHPLSNDGQRQFQAVNGIWIDSLSSGFDRPIEIRDNWAWKNWEIGYWVDGGLISVNARGANNGIGIINGFSSMQKAAFVMHTLNTNFNDTSNDGETGHFVTLARWYAVGSEFDDTWFGNFAPTYSTNNRTSVAAIHGGEFESKGFTPRMRNTKFFNEITSGTNKSHRINFSRDNQEPQYVQDYDGTIVGQAATISDSSPLGSTAASVELYPGETTDGKSWGRYLPGAKYMKVYSIEPNSSPWRINRDSDGRTVSLPSGDVQHGFLMGQRYRYQTEPAAAISSFDLHGLVFDRPGFAEIWIDWAPTTAPKVTKNQYFWTTAQNATVASSLSDLATGKDYFWDQAAKRVYLRINVTGQEAPFATLSAGINQGTINGSSEYSVRQ